MVDASFFSDPVFWGYAIPVIILIIVGLIAAFARGKAINEKLGSDQTSGWTSSMYVYTIIWAVSLLIFLWAVYTADRVFRSQNNRVIYQTLFGFLIAFAFLGVFSFGFWGNRKVFMFSQIFVAFISIGLIFEFSKINIGAAWGVLPLFLLTLFSIGAKGAMHDKFHDIKEKVKEVHIEKSQVF